MFHSKMRDVFENIRHAIWNLPTPIRRVCFVQLFAFMGWFPFLFYSYVFHLANENLHSYILVHLLVRHIWVK